VMAGCSSNVGNTTTSATSTTSPISSASTTSLVSPASTGSPAWMIYKSAKGFAINYPSDWTKDVKNSGAVDVFFALPTNNSAENLNVEAFNSSDTLNSSIARILSGVQEFSNFNQISTGNTTLAGNPAYTVVYTATVGGTNLTLAHIWTIKDGKEYFITYKATPNNYVTYLSTAQKMIDSFQITSNVSPSPTPTPTPTATPTSAFSVFYFHEIGCPYCAKLEASSSFAQLLNKVPVHRFLSTDTQTNKQFGVNNYPTLILLKNGVEVMRRSGEGAADDILARINAG